MTYTSVSRGDSLTVSVFVLSAFSAALEALGTPSFFFFKFLMFIKQRERETQNPKQDPGSAMSTETDLGLELTNREIMT